MYPRTPMEHQAHPTLETTVVQNQKAIKSAQKDVL
jgi:hypothetical protein